MRKIIVNVFLFLLILGITSVSSADYMEYEAGTYETPENYYVIAEIAPIDLNHNKYYTWGFNDFNVPTEDITEIRIVFHDIYNYTVEDNWLTVYLFDNPDSLGFDFGWDCSVTTLPFWEDPSEFGATSLGTWSYDTEAKDVVYSTTSSDLLEYLTNGDTFGIGVDPDCHFFGTSITVETPVPEPATMLLLGSGLIGLAGFGRKRFFKKG